MTTTTEKNNKSVLIVGAGGFIGGFIATESLNRGYDTWCAVRPSTSRRFLTDTRLKFVELDYDATPAELGDKLKESLSGKPCWDYIIYNLGATKCANFADFSRINFQYLKNFTQALSQAGLKPAHFLFMSSLSALGPGDEKNYTPLSATTIPSPNTRYGVSKIKAETHLITTGLPWTIFRPTGVYGPHEQDYLMMIKCIDKHFDFGVGFKRQLLTFIYVKDLANAIFDALESENTIKKTYIISENRAYTQKEFRSTVARLLKRKFVIPLKLPMWIVYIASVIAEKIAVAQLKTSTLNRDKFKIMKQRNWDCDISDAQRDFNFTPRYSLERGLEETIDEYLHQKKLNK